MTASPWVAFSSLVRRPIRPRAGIENDRCVYVAVGLHLLQAAAPLADHLHHGAQLLGGDFDDQRLERLLLPAFALVEDHVGLADRQLVALAAHGLDQHGQVQHAAAGHGVGIAARHRPDPQGDVAFQFAEQPLAEVPGGQEPAVAAGEGRLS